MNINFILRNPSILSNFLYNILFFHSFVFIKRIMFI